MKRILVFFIAILAVCVLSQSCRTVKAPITSVKEHQTEFIVLWLPPEGLDSGNVDGDNKIYMVEGGLLDGTSVLALPKSKRVLEILGLQWKFPSDGYYRGYLFTCDDLGRKSILTPHELNTGGYNEEQKTLLKRHWNERKYDLFSQVSKVPIKGRLDIKTKRIIPLKTSTNELVYDYGVNSSNIPNQSKQQSNNPFEGLGH